MPLVPIRQSSFSAGELAPTFHGRGDLPKYHQGLRRCRNFLPLAHGALTRRPGFRYCGAPKDTNEARLVAFRFANDDQVVLEIGHQYIRFWVSGALLLATAAPAWSSGTTYATGQVVSYSGVGYIALRTTVADQPNVSPSDWAVTTYYQVPTAYTFAQVFDLKFAQSGDYLYITHPSHPPAQLVRAAAVTWSLSNVSFTPGSWVVATSSAVLNIAAGDAADGTHPAKDWRWVATSLGEQVPSAQIAPIYESGPSDSATVANCVLYPDKTPIAVNTGVGDHLKNIYRGLNGIYGWVGQTWAETFYDEGQTPDYSMGPPQSTNPFASANQYPRALAFFDDRLCFAGANLQPSTVRASRVGDYYRFDKNWPAREDGAFSWTIASRDYQQIRSLVDLDALLALTSGGVWSMDGGQDPLSPLSVRVRRQSAIGASAREPLVLEAHILYERVGGGAVLELAYSAEANKFLPRDLSVLARHMLGTHTIKDWCLSTTPHQIVWIVRDDGVLLSLTYQRELDVWAWAQHETAFTTGSTVEDLDPVGVGGFVWTSKFLSVCAVRENGEDIVYALSHREWLYYDDVDTYTWTIGTMRCVERMASLTDDGQPKILDACLSTDTLNNPADEEAVRINAAATVGATVSITGSSSGGPPTASGDVNKVLVVYDEDEYYATGRRVIVARVRITTYYAPGEGLGVALMVSPAVESCVWAMSGTSAEFTVAHLKERKNDVYAVVDGVVQGPFEPNATTGVITLTERGCRIDVGVPCDSSIELLDVAPQEARLRNKSVARVAFEVESSRGAWVGPDEDNLVEAQPTESGNQTCLIEAPVPSGYDYYGRAWLEVRDPLPCTILAVTREIDLGG